MVTAYHAVCSLLIELTELIFCFSSLIHLSTVACRELRDEQATAELPPEERRLRPGVESAAPVADGRGGGAQRQM